MAYKRQKYNHRHDVDHLAELAAIERDRKIQLEDMREWNKRYELTYRRSWEEEMNADGDLFLELSDDRELTLQEMCA